FIGKLHDQYKTNNIHCCFKLSGAPPRPAYFKQLLTLFDELGADGVVIEWEVKYPDAESLGLSVIPLVQTIGHLEWILKTKEFSNLRENASYPMVACIGDPSALELILDSVNQVLTLHSKIKVPYIHIGADELYQMGQCEADKKVLPVKYGNSTKRLVFDFVNDIASHINQHYPKTKVLMWFDELKNTDHTLIKEYGLDRLVTPVVWKYTAELDKVILGTLL
ncbi:hypothetical protein ANCDUO_14484, partial [Ancylostoma duodenale]